jgi:uncharacterized protein YbbC (DUF1343 family)/CubicO group peptidase (beta-lactamase class C family)
MQGFLVSRRARLRVARLSWFTAPLATLWLTSCTPVAVTPPAETAAPLGVRRAPLRADKLAAMDAVINEAILAKKTPGGVLWFERDGETYHKAYGNRAVVPAPEAATADTIYDAASLTKVIATTTAVMQLVERGRIELDAPVARYLPWFAPNGKGEVTVRHLLTHVSGLREDLTLKPAWAGVDTARKLVGQEKLRSIPGQTFLYSDINFITLGELVRAVSGRPLEVYAAQEIFAPLKMVDSGFLPAKDKLPRIAPTELTDGVMLRGVVHDPTSRMMGGVAGHAGLFITAADLARFCRMLINGGQLDGVRILRPETVAEMTRVQTDGSDRRGLGWDLDTRFSAPRGRWFPAGTSYGHTGYTGTSVWIDPGSKSFLIFLGNRVHPADKGEVSTTRRALGTLAAEAIGLDRTAVLNGIDVLVRDDFAPLKGLRVGLITNPSGRDRDGRATIDVLHAAKDMKLVALFAPEHGIRGNADAKVSDTIDEKTKLPIYSLYGETPRKLAGQSAADYAVAVIHSRAPKPEQLQGLDALVFDIQDIGARFFTYPSTMGEAMAAAAKAKIKFIVLDRALPITGTRVEGPVQTQPPSFIGYHPVPVRPGLTIGELARLYNVEKQVGADLTVIRCENWRRELWADQTGLPWTTLSPAMKTITAAALYPGICLVEGTGLSMGRGTLKPFEQVGAPFVDGVKFAAELNAAHLPGVRFEPVKFTPVAELYAGTVNTLKYHNQVCGGVRVRLIDREACNVVDVGITLALALQKLYPKEAKLDDTLNRVGDAATLEAIKAGKPLAEIKAGWAKGLAEFAPRRKAVLLY